MSRFLHYSSLLFGLLLLNFILFNVIPGDPARIMLGPNADHSALEQFRKEFGIDAPLITQFYRYMKGFLSFDLGISYNTRRAVWPDIASSFQITFLCSFIALSIATIYSILSSYIAFISNQRFSRIFTILNSSLVSMPSLTIAVVFGWISIKWNLLGFIPAGDTQNIVLAALVLSIYPSASLSRILLGQTNVLSQKPYVLSARCMGFSNSFIFRKRLLKNALLPWLTQLSNVIAILVGGATVVEVVFSVPGIGRLLFQTIMQRDFPVLQGILATTTFCFITINIFVEFGYHWLNPQK